jgi:hypothetical protein
VKTTAPAPATPQHVETRRRGGGQPGNRNALKTGCHTKDARALRKQVTQWRRTTKALVAQGKNELMRRHAAEGRDDTRHVGSYHASI